MEALTNHEGCVCYLPWASVFLLCASSFGCQQEWQILPLPPPVRGPLHTWAGLD